MKDLIEALQILSKYTDSAYPTGCEHDIMHVYVDPSKVTAEDTERLGELNFRPSEDNEYFYSFRFGSA